MCSQRLITISAPFFSVSQMAARKLKIIILEKNTEFYDVPVCIVIPKIPTTSRH